MWDDLEETTHGSRKYREYLVGNWDRHPDYPEGQEVYYLSNNRNEYFSKNLSFHKYCGSGWWDNLEELLHQIDLYDGYSPIWCKEE